MLKTLWRFRTSLLPGLGIALGLLGFAGLLFGVLLHAADGGVGWGLEERTLSLLRFTLYQATLSTLFSLSVGLMLAWSLAHQPRFRGRSFWVALFASSLVLPSLIVAFGIITVLGNHGWLNQLIEATTGETLGSFVYGLGGILIAHVYLNASFAAIGLLRAFESIPVDKYRLAKSLGLTPWQRFRTVEWVAIRGSLPSIGATIFLLCFSSFAIVLLLGGSPSYNTLEVAIYEAVRIDFDIPQALQLALVQLSISAVLVMAASRLHGGLSNLKESSRVLAWQDPLRWRTLQRGIIALLALLYLLPLVAVFLDGIQADLGAIITRPLFLRSLGMSLSIATVSALLTLLLALLLADARRHFGSPFRVPDGPLSRLASALVAFSGNLYLAIPSLILGLGFFLIARAFGGSMHVWGIVAILTANILMSLPFALAILVPALQKTAQRYDKLVFSLGLSTAQRWRQAEWPYLRRPLGTVGALSFALSLGDLGVVALFGNREITTLPWYLYQLMGSYRTADAAGVALILLVLVVGVFFVVHYEKGSWRAAHR
jgi:thiamine transport system permease protein